MRFFPRLLLTAPGCVAVAPAGGLLMRRRTWCGTTKAGRGAMVGGVVGLAGCEGSPEPAAGVAASPGGFARGQVTLSKQLVSSPFRFAEVAQEAGIDFVHFSGMTEARHFPTANG